jgi:hypothetical protein
VVVGATVATDAWPCATVVTGAWITIDNVGAAVVVVVAAPPVKVNVVVTDSIEYVESAAFVTVSEHVPDVFAVTTPDVSVQVAVPVVTVEVTAPVPEPPVVATVIPVIASPVVVVTARAVCVFLANVTVVAFDESAE